MAIDDHPLTVFNRQIESDELRKPVGAGAITGTAKVAGAVFQIPPLRPFGLVAKGFDFVGKCLAIGVPTVEENLKLFGQLTEDAILSVEGRLLVLEDSAENAEKLQRRVESTEFLQYLASGVLQTQRTRQENRLKRMAWIIANGVSQGDLDPESGDDMMRNAVELTEHDINVLGAIYNMQNYLFSQQELNKESSWRISAIHSLWEEWWKNQAFSSYQGINCMAFNSSFARLQSAGFIASIGTKTFVQGPTMHDYELLPDGKKFYERIQEITVQQ